MLIIMCTDTFLPRSYLSQIKQSRVSYRSPSCYATNDSNWRLRFIDLSLYYKRGKPGDGDQYREIDF